MFRYNHNSLTLYKIFTVIPNQCGFCTNVNLIFYHANMVEHSNCFLANMPNVIGSFKVVLCLLILFMMSIKLSCHVKWTKEYYSMHMVKLIFLLIFLHLFYENVNAIDGYYPCVIEHTLIS